MKLYRIDMDAGPRHADLVAAQELEWLMDHKFLVEVEPCEHCRDDEENDLGGDWDNTPPIDIESRDDDAAKESPH